MSLNQENFDHAREFNVDPMGIKTIPFRSDQGLLVTYNPTSQKAKDHALEIALRNEWPATGIVVVAPTEATIEDNRQMLVEQLKEWPHLHLAILGGDGTVSSVLNAVSSLNRGMISAVSADGNASDLANSVNWGHFKHDPIDALIYGTKGFIRPIEVSVENKKTQTTTSRLAIGYAGIGISGQVAKVVDSGEYRRNIAPKNKINKYLKELGITLDSIKEASIFKVDDRQLVDISLLNGGRMAKTRFRRYEDLFKDIAHYNEITTNNKRAVLAQMGRLALGMTRQLTPGEQIALQLNHDQEQLFMQIDGEPIALPNEAIVGFKLSDKKLAVAKTR